MIKIKKKTIKEIKRILKKSYNIAILTHINPDGDSIGSSTALYQVLKKQNFNVNNLVPNEIPEFLQWLPSYDKIVYSNKNPNDFIEIINNSDVIFCLDFNDFGRVKEIGEIIQNSKATKILIDHHPFPANYFDIIISMIDVSSTSELIFHFIKSIGWKKYIDKDIAKSIYTGIMTDTGCFAYNASYPHTYYVVAELLKYNIDREIIYSNVYDNFSANRMRLLGHTLYRNLRVFPQYRTAILFVTKEEQKVFNFQPGDTEGFVNFPLSIKNIIFSVLFTEKDNHIRLSLRSKGNFAVNEFAEKHFNGGGHFNAAGGESYLSMEETLKKFESLLPEYKNILENA